MSHTVKAERFNARGVRIESVELNANRVGGTVYLYIKGNGPPKHFAIPIESWRALTKETEESNS